VGRETPTVSEQIQILRSASDSYIWKLAAAWKMTQAGFLRHASDLCGEESHCKSIGYES